MGVLKFIKILGIWVGATWVGPWSQVPKDFETAPFGNGSPLPSMRVLQVGLGWSTSSQRSLTNFIDRSDAG